MADEFVLASVDPPSVWNFYPTEEAAASSREDANEYNVRLEKHGAPQRDYRPMTYVAFKASEREFYLSDAPAQITYDKFWEMLEVLPPKNWRTGFDFESFLMIEHWSGPFTHQYARLGRDDSATYWTKMVDASDRSTWMTAESLRKAVA